MDKLHLLQEFRKAQLQEKDSKILELCEDKIVLDVGCIGQDKDYNDQDWLHNKIRTVAKSTLGVDIIQESIDKLNQMGLNIVHFDQLASLDIKFDVIVMADVIEHVDNPVSFLRDYGKYLTDNGIIVVTTPNSNRAINFLSILRWNGYRLNFEHTMWLCPLTFAEIVRRTDLNIKAFYWLKEYYDLNKLNFTNRVIFHAANMLARWRSNFHHNFMVILCK